MGKSILFVLIGLGILAVFVVIAVAIVYAETPSTPLTPEAGWEIESFEADYLIRDDGEVDVTETIVVDFGTLQRHGIFRDRVDRVECPDDEDARPLCKPGKYRTYRLSNIEVEDARGREVQLKKERFDKELQRWRIGDPDVTVSGRQTYVISYTMQDVADPGSRFNELYWNATGTWTVPVESATVRVRFEEPLDDIDGDCFEGPSGSTNECDISGTENGLVFATTERLDFGSEMTFAIRWPSDELVPSEPRYKDVRTLSDFVGRGPAELGITAALAIAALPFAWRLWWRKGRDRRFTTIHYLTRDTTEETMPLFAADDNIVVEFLPPDRLRPAQMGTLINEGATTRDVSATIVDLAVRGYIHIAETGKGRKRDWTFTQVKPTDQELLPYEAALMSHLFAYGRTEVKVSSLKDKFADKLKDVKSKLMADAMERKWFSMRPSWARAIWIGFGIFVTTVAGAIGLGLGYFFGHALVALPLAVLGLGILWFAPHMSQRTAIGSEALRRIMGFELYVATAETRMQEFNEQQNIFARYLPYAMVFECVDKWAKAFRGLENDPETAGVTSWYSGGSGAHFSAAAFSSSMNSFSSSVGSTFSSTPSSSGSGGGGGSSGGGGGGGGGGSW